MSYVRQVDSVDRRLIEALRANARATFAELARLVGLSAPAVHERVGKLESSGVITGYHAVVEPAVGAGHRRVEPDPWRCPDPHHGGAVDPVRGPGPSRTGTGQGDALGNLVTLQEHRSGLYQRAGQRAQYG